MNKIVPQLWMLVPKEERSLLAEMFGLKRTGISEIIDQTVISDGYKESDLEAITLEKMCAYIGSQETFMRAWEITIMKATSTLYPPKVFIGTQEQLGNLPALKEVSNEEFNKLTEKKVEEKKKGKTQNV